MKNKLLQLKKNHFGKTSKNLYSFTELEKLINLRPFITKERLMYTAEGNYSWSGYSWQKYKDTFPISILKKLINKNVIGIADCSRVNKKINSLCLKLEKIFKRPVDCHIFYSSKEKMEGFNKHRDESYNFIVLIKGEIKVEVWGKEKIEKIMKPGEYVFISKNTDHKITPLSNKRLSCSFPIMENEGVFDEREWLNI
jgi:quercetin dioxygenase-like cupin family protein